MDRVWSSSSIPLEHDDGVDAIEYPLSVNFLLSQSNVET